MAKINFSAELGMDDFIPFGKYKDEQVEDVVADDPQYLVWASENTSMTFDEEVLEKISHV